MTYYSETLNIKAGVGSFKALPKRQKSSQKKDFFFLEYWNNCHGMTLGELLIQTSPSSFLPSTLHSSFTPLFRKSLLRPGLSSAMTLPASQKLMCFVGCLFCFFSMFRQLLFIKFPMELLPSC